MFKRKPVKLAYELFEPAQGADKNLPPIIFLHGLAGTKKMWLDIPQEIADRTKRLAYALDARNHGKSEYTDTFDFEDNVIDLLHFMDTINAPKVILVGHDMGGLTSIRATLQNPEIVEKIVVEDMVASNLTKDVASHVWSIVGLWTMCVQSTPRGFSEEDAISFAIDLSHNKLFTGNDFSFPPKEIAKAMGIELVKLESGQYDVAYNKGAILTALQKYDPEAMSTMRGEFKGPALFIYGENSPIQVGNHKDAIKHLFPNVEFYEAEDTSHFVHSEDSEEFVEVVLPLLLK